MRTEALEKEANMYDTEGACYIHVDMAPGSDQYATIMAGDDRRLAQAIYNLIGELAERTKRDPVKILKFYKKMFRKIGVHKSEDL